VETHKRTRKCSRAVQRVGVDNGYEIPSVSLDEFHHRFSLMLVGRHGAKDVRVNFLVAEFVIGGQVTDLGVSKVASIFLILQNFTTDILQTFR